MHIETRSFNKAIYVIGQKIRDIARGHSLEDEARVTRIIKYPSSISPEDIYRYIQYRLNSTKMPLLGTNMNSSFPVPTNLDALFEEQKRQRQLTLKQLIEEVRGDAEGKFKEWKLKPSA